MGTRGAIGFRQNGELKVSYNHYDSYPDGLGEDFLNFAKSWCVDPITLATVKENVAKVKLVDGRENPTEKEAEEFSHWYNENVSTGKDWYSLLREAQGIDGIEAIASGDLFVMTDDKGFLRDSLFCEYAYIIDLDKDTANFYEGFNKHQPKTEFGITSGLDSSDGKKVDGYYPVRTVARIPFSELHKYDRCEYIYGNEYGDE
jgi:hypothetical protein